MFGFNPFGGPFYNPKLNLGWYIGTRAGMNSVLGDGMSTHAKIVWLAIILGLVLGGGIAAYAYFY